jgi:hypothetical protein
VAEEAEAAVPGERGDLGRGGAQHLPRRRRLGPHSARAPRARGAAARRIRIQKPGVVCCGATVWCEEARRMETLSRVWRFLVDAQRERYRVDAYVYSLSSF